MSANSSSTPEWPRLRPVIDGAMDTLSEDDRRIVLLRFFQGRPFGEIGRLFGISEDAARKRSERALDALKGQLARRGITSTAAALGALLEIGAVEAAPAGLAGSIAASATATSVATGTFALTMLTKIQVAGITAILIAGGATLLWQRREISDLQSANRTAEEKLTRAAAEMRDLVRKQERADAELKNMRAAVTAARTSGDAASSTPGKASTPRAEGIAALKQAIAAAQTAKAPDSQQLARLHSRYDPFLKERGLTPEQIDRWIALMAEKDNINQDVQQAVRQYDLPGDATGVSELRSELVNPYWKEMYAMLGPGGDRAFGEYEKLTYFRSYLGLFTSDLTAAGAGLSDAQAEQFVRTIMANHSTVRANATDLGTRSVIDWPTVLQQSSGYLTPAQQAVIMRAVQDRKQN